LGPIPRAGPFLIPASHHYTGTDKGQEKIPALRDLLATLATVLLDHFAERSRLEMKISFDR